eukprot:7955379-Pyramimonas_sp.AAC.1
MSFHFYYCYRVRASHGRASHVPFDLLWISAALLPPNHSCPLHARTRLCAPIFVMTVKPTRSVVPLLLDVHPSIVLEDVRDDLTHDRLGGPAGSKRPAKKGQQEISHRTASRPRKKHT